MGGNRNLRGVPRKGHPIVLQLQGQILHGGLCIARVGIANPLKEDGPIHEVAALVDTGATKTSISVALAAALEITPRTSGFVQSAAGKTECGLAPVLIAFHNGGDRIIHKTVEVAILPMSVPMLFGMSEICPGTLTIDGPASRWTWVLREDGMVRHAKKK